MHATGFHDAVRVTTALTAPLERRFLRWLAVRLPAAINSDHLTVLAFAAMIGGGLAFWIAGQGYPAALIGVVVALVVNWFGDSLDGTLARVRGQQRPRYGFYVDHVIDAFGAVFLLGGLALSGYMHPAIAMGVLIAYLLVSVEVYLATHSLAEFRMSFWRFGPTELRIVLAAGALALLGDPTVPVLGERYGLFDVGGAIAIAGLGATVIASAVRNTRLLYRAEPLPPRAHGEPRRHGPAVDTSVAGRSAALRSPL